MFEIYKVCIVDEIYLYVCLFKVQFAAISSSVQCRTVVFLGSEDQQENEDQQERWRRMSPHRRRGSPGLGAGEGRRWGRRHGPCGGPLEVGSDAVALVSLELGGYRARGLVLTMRRRGRVPGPPDAAAGRGAGSRRRGEALEAWTSRTVRGQGLGPPVGGGGAGA